jgi:hypothetical protein
VRIRRRKVFFESLGLLIQASNFHQCEINWLDRGQVQKGPKNREFPATAPKAKLSGSCESREFLDFFQSSK